MKRKNVTAIVDRQIQGVVQRAGKIREGIESVTVSPGQQAADQIDKMIANWLEAANSGRLEAALRGIDLAAWKERALAGVSRIGPGMEAKRAVILAFHAALQDYQLGYTAQIDAMPDTTLEDGRARMNANFDAMARFRKPV